MAILASNDGLVTLRPAAFGPELARALRSARGRPPRSFAQFLESEVRLPRDGGPFGGQRFRFQYQPIARLWAAEIDSGRWTEFVYTGPSQSGKSLLGYVLPLVWRVAEFGESVGFAVPAEEMAGDKWEADIKPVFEASPTLKRLLPTRGPGSAGGSIRDRVNFTNAAVAKILTAGGRDAAKAGYTLRTVLITEAAAFSRGSSKSTEADPLEQIRARQRSLPVAERITFIEGTPTIESELPTTLRDASSQTAILSPCPHCGVGISPGRESIIGWENARTEVEAAELATWACPRCGELIDAAERLEALAESYLVHAGQTVDKRGRVSGDLPKTRRLYFRYSAWHNAFLSAADIAGSDLWPASRTEPETRAREMAERKLSQFVFGLPYVPTESEAGPVLEREDIDRRRALLPRGLVHADTAHTVAGVDVGQRRLHWGIGGIRPESQLHFVDYGTAPVDHAAGMREGLRAALLGLFADIMLGVTIDGGAGRMVPTWLYVDSGHLPEIVVAACRDYNASIGKEWAMPILGRGETQLDRRRYAAPNGKTATIKRIDAEGRWHMSYNKRQRHHQITIDADHYKRETEAGFRTSPGRPGAITLFAGPGSIHQTFIRQQLAEQWVEGAWKINSETNHYKDVAAYVVAAASRLGFARTAEPITPTAAEHDWDS